MWKNEKFSLTKKIFRQINFLVTYLVKSLLSRNCCQKCVRENSRNFHTVLHTNNFHIIVSQIFSVMLDILHSRIMLYCIVFISRKLFASHPIWLKNEIFTNFCLPKSLCVRYIISPYTVPQDNVEKMKIYSNQIFFSSNQLFSNFFSKNVAFSKFLPKIRESKFPKLPHCSLLVVN